MPAVSVIGEVVSAMEFGTGGASLFCNWRLVTDPQHWQLVTGNAEGQTQQAEPGEDDRGTAVWSHPVDVLYSCQSIRGWPKLYIEVWQVVHGRVSMVGTGFCFVPTTPGPVTLECALWRPQPDNVWDRLRSMFLGDYTRLRVPDAVYKPVDRLGLHAVSTGVVTVQLQVALRGFKGKGCAFTRNAAIKKPQLAGGAS